MLDGHSAVVWQGNLYIWGGKEETSGSRSNVVYSNAMYIVNPNECITKPAATIEKLYLATGEEGTGTAAVPRGRAYHCANLYGKLMFVTGGLSDEPSAADVQDPAANDALLPVFDMERRVWIVKSSFGDVPCARCHHIATVYGDTLMVHGGYPVLPDRTKELTSEEMTSMQHAMYDVHELNLTTMRWRRVHTSQSPALWGHTAITFGKNVIVFGGVDVVENAETGAVAVWHTERKAWRWADFQNLDLRCAMHTAVQDSGRMFVFSGVSFKSHQKLRTLYEFNFEFGSWRELHPKGTLPLGRIGHAAVAYNQCMLVIGGSAEQPNNSSMTGGRVERVVHVYNITLNEWRTCALVSPQQAAGTVQRFQAKEKSWTSGTLDETAMSSAKQEWEQTSQQVRATIAKAKAIQSLAETAAGTLMHVDQGGDGSGSGYSPLGGSQPRRRGSYNGLDHSTTPAEFLRDGHPATPGSSSSQHLQMPLNSSGRPVIPFDDGRREEEERERHRRLAADANASPAVPAPSGRGYSRVAQTEMTPAQEQLDRLRGLREGLETEESRRVIEHLQRENDRLKSQLEDFRAHSLSGPNSNPYEVPVYNAAAAASPSRTLPPNEGVVAPSEAPQKRLMHMAEFVPRLNLNVADPPRATGASAGSFMSRSSVSAIVQSSLNKDTKASSYMALPPPSARVTSMDPMSFLTAPGAGLGSSGGGGVGRYDQLLARPPIPTIGSGDAAGLPLTLQPLLTLIGNTSGIGNPMTMPMSNSSFGGGGAATPYASIINRGATPQGLSSFSGITPGLAMGGGGGGAGAASPMQGFNGSFASQMGGGGGGFNTGASFSSASGMMMQNGGGGGGIAGGGGGASAAANQYKSPSLTRIVSGQASMLSLPPRH